MGTSIFEDLTWLLSHSIPDFATALFFWLIGFNICYNTVTPGKGNNNYEPDRPVLIKLPVIKNN
jgi:hypothetical protein